MFLRTGQASPSRYVGATQDLTIAWDVDRHITVRFLAAYYEVGTIPSRNTAFRKKRDLFFGHSELQVLSTSHRQPCPIGSLLPDDGKLK